MGGLYSEVEGLLRRILSWILQNESGNCLLRSSASKSVCIPRLEHRNIGVAPARKHETGLYVDIRRSKVDPGKVRTFRKKSGLFGNRGKGRREREEEGEEGRERREEGKERRRRERKGRGKSGHIPQL